MSAPERLPRVLIIAGSDSGGGAGIQADVKAVTMLGGHAMTAITAITAQNTLGVTDVLAITPAMVLAQMDAVLEDIGADAVKIGMIGSAETANAVAERLERLPGVPVVFDPVMIATSGATLADAETVAAFERLMKIAALVTPNAPELAVLAARPVETDADVEEAAQALAVRTGTAVLAKGGHVDSIYAGVPVIRDVLATGEAIRPWSSGRIETTSTHGTGCTLASAVATGLAGGLSLERACSRARAYVRHAIRAAPALGSGAGPIGHTLGGVPFDCLRPMDG